MSARLKAGFPVPAGHELLVELSADDGVQRLEMLRAVAVDGSTAPERIALLFEVVSVSVETASAVLLLIVESQRDEWLKFVALYGDPNARRWAEGLRPPHPGP